MNRLKSDAGLIRFVMEDYNTIYNARFMFSFCLEIIMVFYKYIEDEQLWLVLKHVIKGVQEYFCFNTRSISCYLVAIRIFFAFFLPSLVVHKSKLMQYCEIILIREILLLYSLLSFHKMQQPGKSFFLDIVLNQFVYLTTCNTSLLALTFLPDAMPYYIA